jgi:hypothetical protein
MSVEEGVARDERHGSGKVSRRHGEMCQHGLRRFISCLFLLDPMFEERLVHRRGSWHEI